MMSNDQNNEDQIEVESSLTQKEKSTPEVDHQESIEEYEAATEPMAVSELVISAEEAEETSGQIAESDDIDSIEEYEAVTEPIAVSELVISAEEREETPGQIAESDDIDSLEEYEAVTEP